MIETTEYYDEFLRYFALAKDQQAKCNLGTISYPDSGMNDDLMEQVELYDVVERKYAGFSQIVNDAFYGWTDQHPYWPKMSQGIYSRQRKIVATDWTNKHSDFKLPEWLYVFLVHRITGSGINYSTKPSGYHNTILFNLYQCKNIEEMTTLINHYNIPFYTSIGYQFPSFPKIPPNTNYKRAGDYYLTEFAPTLVRELAEWLESGTKRDFREIGDWMFAWNAAHNLKMYRFQYAAFIADIADWYPQYVNRDSMFYYGSNSVQAMNYLAINTQKLKGQDFLDNIMEVLVKDTGGYPYNLEDVCCDFIRWVENYVKPGTDYNHLNFDAVWSSCKIKDHPFGRQKVMLDLGLVQTFNDLKFHPTGDKIIKDVGLSVEEYKKKVYDAAQ